MTSSDYKIFEKGVKLHTKVLVKVAYIDVLGKRREIIKVASLMQLFILLHISTL